MTSPSQQTRGFLFADLRGYSRFAEQQGDRAAAELIRRYRALVRERISTFDGAEIRTEGDSFYVIFASVSQAVRAGLAIRDAAAEPPAEAGAAPIRVGIGIHAGEVEDGEDGIVSSAVNIAARVCAVAEPGEVLVTDTVRSLTRSALPVVYHAAGRRRLKGITEPVTVYRVELPAGVQPMESRRPLVVVRLVALALALLAVVVAMTVGWRTITRDQAALTADQSPIDAPSHSIPTEPSFSAAPSASPEASAFPDAEEAALLERLPDDVARNCERTDAEGAPSYERTLSNAGRATKFIDVPLGVYGVFTCLVDLNRVTFWRSIGAGNIDAVFTRQTVLQRVSPGSCDGSDARGWEPWAAGSHRGKVMCYRRGDGTAVLEWIYEDEPLYAMATRHNGDALKLLAWWREDGRLLGR